MSLPPFALSLPRPEGRYHPADAYHRASLLLDASSPLEAIEVLTPAIEAEPESAALRTLRAYAYFLTAQLHRGQLDCVLLAVPYPCGDVDRAHLFDDWLFVASWRLTL